VLSVISLTGVLFVACGVYHSIFTVLEQMLLIVIVSSAAAAAAAPAQNLVHYSAAAALGGYGR
jgi:hypothetical protein